MKEFIFENKSYVLKSDFEKYRLLYDGMKQKSQIQEQLKLLYNQLGHLTKFTPKYHDVETWTKALQWVLDHEHINSSNSQKLVIA